MKTNNKPKKKIPPKPKVFNKHKTKPIPFEELVEKAMNYKEPK